MAVTLSAWQIPCQFYLALQNKNVLQAENLIDNGADVDYRYREGNKERPAICIAAQHGDYFMCLLLIQKGCSVNQVDSDGMTPLFYACQNADFKLVILFIKNGANLHICDYLHRSALHFAVQGKNLDIIKQILEVSRNINQKDTSGNTPLSIACALVQELSPEIIVFLIRAGASLNVVDASGHFPLHYSHIMNHKTLTIILHSYFSNPKSYQPFTSPNTNIAMTSQADKVNHVESPTSGPLTADTLNFNCRTRFGETPLHILIKNEGLSTRGSKSCPDQGTTSEHDSTGTLCRNESPTIHDLITHIDQSLLAYLETSLIAYPYVIDRDGGFNENSDLRTLHKVHTLLNFCHIYRHHYSHHPKVQSSSRPLWLSPELDAQDNLGVTPLHQAITNGKMVCAEYLIKRGARCDIKDSIGLTAVHYLCHRVDKVLAHMAETDEALTFLEANSVLTGDRSLYGNVPSTLLEIKDTIYVLILVYRSTMQFAGFIKSDLLELLPTVVAKVSSLTNQSRSLGRFMGSIAHELKRIVCEYASSSPCPAPLTWYSRAKLRDWLGDEADVSISILFDPKRNESSKLPLRLKQFLLYHFP